jgi:hypothetical protein
MICTLDESILDEDSSSRTHHNPILQRSNNMAFVNERITAEKDQDRYKIPEIKRRIVPGYYSGSSTCTIDHERDIYLIKAAEKGDWEHRPTGLYGWVFVWHGYELWVETELVEFRGGRGEPGWSRKRITRLGLMGNDVRMLREPRYLPPELEPRRKEILKDLYDALLAYKDFGVLSSNTTYELTLDVAEGV